MCLNTHYEAYKKENVTIHIYFFPMEHYNAEARLLSRKNVSSIQKFWPTFLLKLSVTDQSNSLNLNL